MSIAMMHMLYDGCHHSNTAMAMLMTGSLIHEGALSGAGKWPGLCGPYRLRVNVAVDTPTALATSS